MLLLFLKTLYVHLSDLFLFHFFSCFIFQRVFFLANFTEKMHAKLKEDGGIKALLEVARSGHKDVIAQVARGFANFAKCDSRGGMT